MSVWEYLDLHYMHGIVYDEDFFQDMQLPFKCMQDTQPLQVLVYTPVLQPCFTCAGKHWYPHTSWQHKDWELAQDPSISGIFRPPRPGFPV